MRRKFWVLFVIAVVVLFIVIYVLPGVSGKLVQTNVAEYDTIRVTDKIKCYFIRDEKVITAGSSGELIYSVEEGEKLRKGMEVFRIASKNVEAQAQLAEITERIDRFNKGKNLFVDDLKKIQGVIDGLKEDLNASAKKSDENGVKDIQNKIAKLEAKKVQIETTVKEGKKESERLLDIAKDVTGSVEKSGNSYNCKDAGIVSYYIDGYEAEFTPENIPLLKRDKVEGEKYEVVDTKRNETAVNEPVAKIIKGNVWYAIAWIEKENLVKYEKGNTVSLVMPDGKVSGVLTNIIEQDGEYLIVIKFTKYYKQFAQIRSAEVEIITMDAEGLKVRNDSLTTKNGQVGVYAKSISGQFQFVPVKILSSNGEFTLVESGYYEETIDNKPKQIRTIDLYDEIKSSPGKPKDTREESKDKEAEK